MYVQEKATPIDEPSYGYIPDLRVRRRWTSLTEILHLSVGSLIVMAVGLSYVFQLDLFLLQGIVLVSSALVFTSVFFLHEFAHKAVAKYYGLWAEFRLNLLGVVITLLSIFLPIKLVSPGAVIISGEADRKIIGKTALAGPLTNMILASLFLTSSPFIPRYFLPSIVFFGAMLSSWISLFNLFPFSIMDGAKVFWWNRKVWVISFFGSLILTLVVSILF